MTKSKLNKSSVIWTLAIDLGIKNIRDPVDEILKFCEKRVKKILQDFSDCKNLTDLLDFVAAKMNTSFCEIHTDEDLWALQKDFICKGEKIFANLKEELNDDVFGITFKRTERDPWEHEFVSVIDCRGSKGYRSYFTKWHEISHLLVLTKQQRLKFMRTNFQHSRVDPEEAMVDIIAGRFGFYSPFIRKNSENSDLTFERIDELRAELCPEASIQDSLIGFVQAWPEPCILAYCELGFKKGEQALVAQMRFDFLNGPTPLLRATKITQNQASIEASFRIFRNMRVPVTSVIYNVFEGLEEYAEAEENLSMWEASDGKKLRNTITTVRAKRYGSGIFALINPRDQL